MKTNDYLNAAKTKLGIESDYGLAKALEVERQSMTGFRSGERHMPLDVAFRLAIILEIDPAHLVAEIEAERETKPKKAAFWRSFLQRAAMLAVLTCTLALSFTAISTSGPAGAGFRLRRRQCA